jgi:tetratricopeptide (TPR) repeat protein
MERGCGSRRGIMAAGPVEGQGKAGDDQVGEVPPRLLVPGPSVMVALAAVFKRLSPKELAAKSGLKYRKVLNFLNGELQGELLKLLRGAKLRPAEVRILDSCIQAWSGLDTAYFSDDELELIELEAAEAAQRRRAEVKLALRGGGAAVQARDIAIERARGEEMREGLERLKRHAQRAALVKALGRYHHWAFAVACAEYSLRQTRKDPRSAIEWAELGCLAAEAADGDCSGLTTEALRGWCGSHLANALRVQSNLPASNVEMTLCLDLWESGSDPAGLLDPGRVYELAASLWIDQRQPEEALRFLNRAEPLTRRPAHLRLRQGRALSNIGKYEEAVSVYLGAEELVEAEGDLHLENGRKFNLSSCLVQLARYDEAAALLPEIRRIAGLLGDVLDLHRATWLEGRILRGRGEREEALEHLATAAAAFESLDMDYDAALARFEEATLHLELMQPGRAAEIAGELVASFEAQGVHKEAAKAIRLFQEAVLTETITAELTRSVLNYLYLARHQVLVFQGEI